MNSANTTTVNTFIGAIAVALVLTSGTLPKNAYADSWELLTTNETVPGTRKIESGDPEEGIRLSRIFLGSAYGSRKLAILTNLCVGHIMIGQYKEAEKYCETASSRNAEGTVTHSNLGVLRAVSGDSDAAAAEFATAIDAGCFGECKQTMAADSGFPRPVARRNMARIEQRIAVAQQSDEDQQVASNAD